MKKVLLYIVISLVTPLAVSAYSFQENLTLGSHNAEVVELQEILIAEGHLTLPQGVSKGYFGTLTQAALQKYQEIKGIVPTSGYFGPLTRSYINSNIVIAPSVVATTTDETEAETKGTVVSQEVYFGKQITSPSNKAPKITDVSVKTAKITDRITIYGENFGSKVTIHSSVGTLENKRVTDGKVIFNFTEILGNLSEVSGMPVSFSIGNSNGISAEYGYIVLE